MNFRSIVITGASSGIGAALARALSAPGRTLALLGRDTGRLEAVAAACRAKGAICRIASVDVSDTEALRAVLVEGGRETAIDLLIANAGILDGRSADETVERGSVARRVLETNLLATLDVVHLVLPAMQRNRRGSIVLVASLAALVPLPDAPAYSASKAGLLSYGLALRDAVAAEGIRVVVACPGFVATAMAGRHLGPRPGEISADDAAARILTGLRRNRAMIGFPFVPFWLSRLSLLVPEAIRRRGMKDTRFHVGP
ncbi:SDR family NAD(P)-dependent oxidoreductase [uncultured Reyranella sp.]|uniref:SDR family NAD(P)-dependent oxidoreductase n=1 Tax=uncultured Reyranella sp. TaxID=735512 RepID=UPI0025CE6CB0|nr:SDR family NAD(P)-dependent oxidoreductase [uncultured Reyranella sp.]